MLIRNIKQIGTACVVLIPLLFTQAVGAPKVVSTPPANLRNSNYNGNRAPLLPSPLIKLPAGSIHADGWLKHQMELMNEGFSGRLSEISSFCKFETSAWVNPKGIGQNPWEELSYWLKGYTALGYATGDKRVVAEAEKWVKGILSTSRPDGYFGPQANLESMDLWANMPALYALRTYYEATGDKRALTVMTNYFRWMQTVPFDKLLNLFWEKSRGGDNLDVIYWLYNQTGEKFLLDVARVNHERTADWTGTVANWHGVNIGQCFREPGQFYQQTKDIRYLNAAERNYDNVRDQYGQVPGGMYGSDENCRPGYTGPRQGAETCAMVEMMYSCEMLGGISGDITWLDRCEDVALNSFPASMTPNLDGLHYITCPNQVQLDRVNKAPMVQDPGDLFSYDPRSYRCCQHNVAMGWPYYAEHLWMATSDSGVAATLYAANSMSAKVGKGNTVKITETTDYPFSDTISLAISIAKPTAFPLYLRIPAWCSSASVGVNAPAKAVAGSKGKWIVLSREWKNGDKVNLTLPMDITTKVWDKNRNTVSVNRGPLTYSLKIGERWSKYRPEDKWPGWEVYPTTPWNYGLVIDTKNPMGSIKIEKAKGQLADQPFTPENAPIILKAKAKRIPQWQLEDNGLVQEVRKGPIVSDEPVEEVTLIPMGCARLRISSFPQIGEGPQAKVWDDRISFASASYVFDTLTALNDDLLPTSSADRNIARFTWWDHLGSKEWVQYDFSNTRKVSMSEAYWFDDRGLGGQVGLPASWQILYMDANGGWKPVENASGYGIAPDTLNKVTFAPVETKSLRLEAQLRPGLSAGLLEWRVED